VCLVLGQLIGKANAIEYIPYGRASSYEAMVREQLSKNRMQIMPVATEGGVRKVRIGDVVVPEGSRIICTFSHERPSTAKRCADGSAIYSTHPVMCSNPQELYDVQVSSSPPSESKLLDSWSAANGRYDRVQRCVIYLPPKK
jgi:hypothetical protein